MYKKLNETGKEIVEGIVYYKEPVKVDYVEYGYAHLDCDAIIIQNPDNVYEIYVVCEPIAPEYCDKLLKLFKEEYTDEKYLYYHGITSGEVNSID